MSKAEKRIDHLAFRVKDIEIMRQFYLKYFDVICNEKYLNPQKQFTSYFICFREGISRIELMHHPNVLHKGHG